MLHEIYQNLPLHISPIAFMLGSFAVRWYAISYIVGFFSVYLLLIRRIKRGEADNILQNSNANNKIQNTRHEIQDTTIDFLLIAFFAALLGGRVGYVFFYNFSYFVQHPIAVISPFESGHFAGFFGMSFHGALLAVIVASALFLKKKKINFGDWSDFVVPAIPLGYTLGRIGNFLNGELYGRVTNSSFGMHFIGQTSTLRYPSQLIEALLEGFLLFGILWSVRNKNFAKHNLFYFYFIGYALARIVSEQFREPDPQLGFIFLQFTMGQMLSFVMFLLGALFFIFHKKKKMVY